MGKFHITNIEGKGKGLFTSGDLKKGDILTIVGTKGDWYFIKLEDGRTGWTYKKLFPKFDETVETGGPLMEKKEENIGKDN